MPRGPNRKERMRELHPAKARIVAPPGFDRWLVPPAALAVHLCIGMAYGFSVFWLPLSRAIGVDAPVVCPGLTLGQALVTTSCDWRVSDLIWMYTLFFVVLGSSAALFGGWLERVGPRRAGLLAAACWCGGMLVTAFGVHVHQLWLMWRGSGVIGGFGLGLGYISPVSTLIRWFPDRRGLATGMAIMGFGGGAIIGSPLADRLMKAFAGPGGVGAWQALAVLAVGYAIYMVGGAMGYRLPAAGWNPGNAPMRAAGEGRYTELALAHRTPQFWMLWAMLCLNVSAAIGLIGVASPLIQELFGGRLIGALGASFAGFDTAQKAGAAAVGAGFVGLLSFFNIAGRFAWASLSDRIGRRATYFCFFGLGMAAFLAAPALARSGSLVGFVAAMCLIASMYGGGFAAIPAYLADLFGTRFVGAIHGRLLTAWSVAGVVGPLLVTHLLDRGRAAGQIGAALYGPVYQILAGLLAAGFVINLLVRPVATRFVTEDKEEPLVAGSHVPATDAARPAWGPRVLAWGAVLIPLAWGAWQTLAKAQALVRL